MVHPHPPEYLVRSQDHAHILGLLISDIVADTGNEYELFHQRETGTLDFRWMREFGSTWRTRGYFGVRVASLFL